MLKLISVTRSSLLHYGVGLIAVCAALLFLYPNLYGNIFSTGTGMNMFMPHGHCYFWEPSLVVLHVLSDSIIGISYVAISVTLAYLVHRARRDIPFHWVLRMQNLIDDLLTFSRVTMQAQPFVPVNLRRITDEVLSDLETRVETTNATVEIGELATIDAEPTQMRQLLQNLIGNALKFNRAGVPPVVKISGQILKNNENAATDTMGAIFRLTVEDNGIGFESKNLDRIFMVFQRLHGRSEYEGTGIGLAVCRKIVERHGGGITAESIPGEGTTFVVDLPLKQQEKIKQ